MVKVIICRQEAVSAGRKWLGKVHLLQLIAYLETNLHTHAAYLRIDISFIAAFWGFV